MAKKQLNLTYALRDNLLVHISDVESGLNCRCVCPACNEPLVARKGEKVSHHFAHHTGHVCEYGYETSLHLAAKEILLKTKFMTIPAVKIHFPHIYRANELISEATKISIDSVELEQKVDRIIPDVIVYCGAKRFIVEIFVTHPIDNEKLSKIRALDISTIEINLSKKDSSITNEELQKILLEDSPEKTWRYNSLANSYLQKFYSICEKKDILLRRHALHVDFCPISARTRGGKAYANVMDDCTDCKYCFLFDQEKKYILCAGKQRISNIKDFQIPSNIRIQNSNKEIEDEKEHLLAEGWCPICNEGQLIPRENAYGSFLGCSRYPYCKFTASIDPETGEIIPNTDPKNRQFKRSSDATSLPKDSIFSLAKESKFRKIKIAQQSWLANKWVIVNTIKINHAGYCKEVLGSTHFTSSTYSRVEFGKIDAANKPLWRILEIIDEPMEVIIE